MGESRIRRAVLFMALFLAVWAAAVSAQRPEGDGDRRPCRSIEISESDRLGSLGFCARAPRSAEDETVITLQLGTDIAHRAILSWEAGDRIGVVLEGSSLQYPLAVNEAEVYLVTLDGWPANVDVRFHVYAMEGSTPGALLGSSAIATLTLPEPRPGSTSAAWFTVAFDTPIELATPQPFLLAIEYMTGAVGGTPSVLIDLSNEIPRDLCFYADGAAWDEHYERVWQKADGSPLAAGEVGYPMMRAGLETSGGPSDSTVTMAEADTWLSSAWPQGEIVDGFASVFWVGHAPASGDTRGLIRFANPEPPIVGATPVAATLRLFQANAITATVPLTITTYRMTEDWYEPVTGWVTHAQSFAEAYGSDTVPAKDIDTIWNRHLLEFDVGELVIAWLNGQYENRGIMLIANPEGVIDGRKELRSRDAVSTSSQPELPRLLVEWQLPEATPIGTPPHTLTPTPTKTVIPSATPTLSATPSPTITDTPPPTPSETPTLTPDPSNPTPTEDAGGALFLPLVLRAF